MHCKLLQRQSGIDAIKFISRISQSACIEDRDSQKQKDKNTWCNKIIRTSATIWEQQRVIDTVYIANSNTTLLVNDLDLTRCISPNLDPRKYDKKQLVYGRLKRAAYE